MLARVRAGWRWQLLLSLAVASAAGCATSQPRASMAGVQGISGEDRVGIDDVFEVRVYGEPDLTGSYPVAVDGSVDSPLAGRLKVVGLRSGEIQQLLVTKLK